MKPLLFTTLLYGLTAIAEIVGCYLPLLWLQQRASLWVLAPAALSLMLFVWLLSLHPAASGRVYAAYAGVYMVVGLLWLWVVDGIRPTAWDCAGAALALTGMVVMVLAPRAGS
jgi:small multidrug resistance family-3 protein